MREGEDMYSRNQRIQIVDALKDFIISKYPQIDKYNILIFGSFLTDRYHEGSDIDIGVFSLDRRLMFQLYMDIIDYLEKEYPELECDVIRMELDESQYINVNIILHHEQEFTGYCPDALIAYTKKMVSLYGTNPMDAIRKKIVQEVGLNDGNW